MGEGFHTRYPPLPHTQLVSAYQSVASQGPGLARAPQALSLRLQWGYLVIRPPVPMGDPGVSDRGWGTHRGPDIQQMGGDQFSWGKCQPVLKSCQALGPEVRNSKEKEETESVCGGGGDPEDIMEAQRSRGAEEGARVQRESKTPSLGVR